MRGYGIKTWILHVMARACGRGGVEGSRARGATGCRCRKNNKIALALGWGCQHGVAEEAARRLARDRAEIDVAR